MRTFAIQHAVMAVAIGLSTLADATAADRVWLEPPQPTSTESDWYPRAIEIVDGSVIDFDAQRLRMAVSGDQTETTVAAGRVIWIESGGRSAAEKEAIDLFESGDFAASVSKLPQILKQEPRPPEWRQEWMTMLAANAAWKSGRSRIALELVSQLDKRRELPPMVISWLPVAWRNGQQPVDATTAAKTRLGDPSPAVQMVAASWLLSSPDRAQATAVLGELRRHPRQEIAQLSEILLWRTATPPQVEASAGQWQQRLDQLPMVYQVGPSKTLADRLRSAGQGDAADRVQWSHDLTPIHPSPK